MATVAPSCGTPLESRTRPDNFPRLETDLLSGCAEADGAPQVTPTAKPSNTPKHRRAPRFTRLPPWCDVRRSLLFHGVLHGELRGTGNGRIRQQVGCVNLESILPRNERGQWQKSFDGHLIARLLHFRRCLFELHHLLVALLHRVDE